MDSALEYHITIKELPVRERPRERLRDYGPSALSTPELLAIILRTGTARENVLTLAQGLLADLKGLEGLANASFPELQNRHGIGEAKAAQLLAALELGRRLAMAKPDERPRITSPADVRNLVLAEMAHLEQEELWVILLNTKNQVLGVEKLYRGSLNASTIRIGELFKAAIRANCAAVILVHNHPSGD
ncbi:MAG: DNA repair protein RadC, partial [Chloroflexi bacterium]|nr:DNA repair protein RadC [Chloroflexota bacterium]